MALGAAYWREHPDRQLAFRTCDGSIAFTVRPTRGMPPGAPESPMIDAAIIEDVTAEVEERLVRQRLPAGIRADDDQTTFDIGRDTNASRPFQAGDSGFLNLADDHYDLAGDTRSATYMVSSLAEDMATKGQMFNESKSEWLHTHHIAGTPPPKVWTAAQLSASRRQLYRHWPPSDETQAARRSTSRPTSSPPARRRRGTQLPPTVPTPSTSASVAAAPHREDEGAHCEAGTGREAAAHRGGSQDIAHSTHRELSAAAPDAGASAMTRPLHQHTEEAQLRPTPQRPQAGELGGRAAFQGEEAAQRPPGYRKSKRKE